MTDLARCVVTSSTTASTFGAALTGSPVSAPTAFVSPRIGADKGGNLHGTFPAVGVDDAASGFNNPDMAGNALIPTTLVVQ